MRRLLPTLICLSACTPEVHAPAPLPNPAEQPHSETAVRLGAAPIWGTTAFPGPAFVDTGVFVMPEQFPNPRAAEPLFTQVGVELSRRGGFCTTCNVVFTFDGGIDLASLDGRVVIVDLDDGTEVPTDVQWQAEADSLTLRPARGHVLGSNRRYAAVLRPGVLGLDGLPVVLPEGVDDLGFGRDIAAVTSFRTGEPASELRAIRDVVRSQPAPRATVDRTWTAAELDELLGDAAMAEAGFRPTGEQVSLRHTTTSTIVTGSFSAPRFLDGTGSDVGVLQRTSSGAPQVTATEDVSFVLIVPKDVDLSNLPVVVAHHGFNASRVTALTLADTAGAAGWAVLGIDAYQHGRRARSAVDRRNEIRDVDGEDGFEETNKLDVVARVFGFSGVPQDLVLSPEYALSAFTQFVADSLSAVHFVQRGDTDALRRVEGLEDLQFDPDRVVFVGNSMGAVVGTGVIAAEPELAGAVLNVMPGSIIETLIESGEFRPLMERVMLPLLGIDEKFDEVDRSMAFDPTVDLFRWVMEPVDPLALAGSSLVDNVLVQLAGHDEVAAPRPSQSVVDAAQFERVTLYPGAMHGMMEVEMQVSKFTAPLVPPLARREQPQQIRNPIEDVHDEITDFLLAVDSP